MGDNRAFIYRLINLKTGDFYVGQTMGPIEKRLKSHLARSNLQNKNIRRDLDNYGKNSFKIELLETCTEWNKNQRESHWKEKLRPTYNMKRDMPKREFLLRTTIEIMDDLDKIYGESSISKNKLICTILKLFLNKKELVEELRAIISGLS